jgi:hypothetical protein
MGFLIAAAQAIGAAIGGSALLGNVVRLGVGLLLSALTAPKAPKNTGVQPNDGQVLFTDAVGERVKRYGRTLAGGQVVFQRGGGSGAQTGDTVTEALSTGRYLHRIIVHCVGEISRFVECRIDGRPRNLEADGRVLAPPFDSGNNGSRLRIETRAGAATSTPYDGPEDAAPEWGAAHRLDGLATTYLRCEQRDAADQQDTYPNGPTQIAWVLDGAKVRDPRTGLIGYTDNAALVIADWIESADGFGRAGVLDETDMIAAANEADILRPLSTGGSVRRWRLAGAASLAVAPEGPLQQMLAACAGDLRLKPDGKIGLSVGGDREPVVTLTDEDVLEFLDIDDGPDALDRYTELPFIYVDEGLEWVETTGDPWVNAAEEARIGASVTGPGVDLRFAPNHAQARHAAKILSVRQNPPKRATIRFKPVALMAIYERTVRLEIAAMGLSGVFRVEPYDMNVDDLTVTLQLTQTDVAAGSWSVAEEGVPQALPPEQEDDDRPPSAPESVQAFGFGSSGNAGIIVVDGAPRFDDTLHYVAWRTAGSESWTSAPRAADARSVTITGLTAGLLYDVAVIAATSEIYDPDDADGTDVRVLNVGARDDDPVPAAPTGLSVTPAGGGAAVVTVTASGSAFARRIEVLRNGVVVFSVQATPGQVIEFADASGAGSYTWTARAVSISDRLSATTTGVTATIT